MFSVRFFVLVPALILALSQAPAAFAHAHPVTTSPSGDAQLGSAPTNVTITFDDDLDPSGTTIAVMGPNGQQVSSGSLIWSTSAPKVAGIVLAPTGSGTYTVRWHAVADDDKGVTEGTFTFVVNSPVTAAQPSTLPGSGEGGMATAGQRHAAEVLLALLVLGGIVAMPLLPRAHDGRS